MTAAFAAAWRRLRGGERSISADTLRIYGLQALTLGLALAANVLLARVLGPAGKGQLDLFQLTLTMAPEIALFGLASGLMYELANRGRPIGEVHGTGLAGALALGSVAALAGTAGLGWWQVLMPGVPAWALLLGVWLAPLGCYRLVWSVCMTGINRAVATHVAAVAIAAGGLALYGAVWGLGALTPAAAILCAGVAAAGAALLSFAILRAASGRLSANLPLAGRALRKGGVLWIGLLANVLHFRLDQLMLNQWMGADAVGVYTVAVRWAEMLFVLDGALISAALYKISALGERESHALVRRLVRAQAAISGAGAALLALGAWPLVHALYGAPYLGAVVPLLILIPAVVCWSLAKVWSQYLAFQRGAMWIPAAFAVAGLALNVVLNWWWIPWLGLPGAALASAGSYGFVMTCTGCAFVWLGRRR